jgi:NADH-quinone oxidoreductase subunit L
MVWLVFFGHPRAEAAHHAHDAQPAMRLSLVVLAIGTLTTWLLAGAFSQLIHNAFTPFLAPAAEGRGHEIVPALSTLDVVLEVVTAPATLVALAVIVLGLAAWWWRDKLTSVSNSLHWLGRIANDSFGFEAINSAVAQLTQNVAGMLRLTQTGYLNWNIVGIVGGLILVLAVVALGAAR